MFPKQYPFPPDIVDILDREARDDQVLATRSIGSGVLFEAFSGPPGKPSGLFLFDDTTIPGIAKKKGDDLSEFRPAHILIEPTVHRTAPWDGAFRAVSFIRYDGRFNPGIQDRETGRLFCDHDKVFEDADEAFHTSRVRLDSNTKIGDPVRTTDAIPEPDEEEWQASWVKTLAGKIDEAMEQRLDYAETHKDAGDAYTHLPREGSWQNGNGDDRLKSYVAETGLALKGLDLSEVSELVLDNFRMESGTIFDPTYQNPDMFLVSSFPVLEVEEQISKKDIMSTASDADWEAAKTEASTYFSDGGLAYATSDRVWYAVIDKDALEELISDRALEASPEP